MRDVSTTVTIAARRDRVAAYAADPANAPAWFAHVKAGRWVTPGSRFEFIARLPLRRTVTFGYDVIGTTTAWMTFRTNDTPLPMETSYIWSTDRDGATVMTMRNRWNPNGPVRLVAPILTLAMRHANRKDLVRLKSLPESGDG